MSRPSVDSLSPSEAAALARWGDAVGWPEVARLAGVSRTQASRAARLLPVTVAALTALRTLAASEPTAAPARCCSCGAVIEGAPDRLRRACEACREATRQGRLLRRRLAARARPRTRTPAAHPPSPAPSVAPCPGCGAARRREGKLAYCPRRCEAGLTLSRRTP